MQAKQRERPEADRAARRLEPTRREFFHGLARNAVLAGIAVVAALAGKAGRSRQRQKCLNQGICRGCKAFDTCGLPQALSAKRATSG